MHDNIIVFPKGNPQFILPQNPNNQQMGEQIHSESHEPFTTLLQPTSTTETESTITTVTADDISLQASSSSKLPFRSRKIRKVSSTATPSGSDGKSEPVSEDDLLKGGNRAWKRNAAQSTAALPTIVKSLSCEGELDVALRHLTKSDPLLAALINTHQPPTFDSFHPPFLALAKSILYQQLAYKAATSIYTRFVALCGGEAGVVPDAVLALSPSQLRQIGVSGRKAGYLHDLASKYKTGILSDSSIMGMDDKSLFTMLTMVKGIGSWSVHMFMIFSLHRPDVLPVGDVGVRKGVQFLYGLEELPRPSQMEQLCEKWKPYRSVGSWYMWRFVEAKGAPPARAAVALVDGATSEQQQQQEQQQQPQQLQLVDPINGIVNLGACIWGQ